MNLAGGQIEHVAPTNASVLILGESGNKARLLEQEQGGLIAGTSMPTQTSSTTSMPFLTLVSSTGAALDFATVMKASRTISREVDLDGLVKKLIRIAVETAGAQRGYLLLMKKGTLLIEASSTFDQGEVRYRPAIEIGAAEDVPASIVNYVTRTKEILTIADAAEDSRFSGDVVVHRLKSESLAATGIFKKKPWLVSEPACSGWARTDEKLLQCISAKPITAINSGGPRGRLVCSNRSRVALLPGHQCRRKPQVRPPCPF